MQFVADGSDIPECDLKVHEQCGYEECECGAT
jgi:hypothetical protein